MIYELRTYTAMPGRLPELNRRFREHTTKIWEGMGWQMVGFWTYKFGGTSDQLVYMLAWEDQATRDAQWALFQANTDWQAARTASEVNGPLVARISADILLATDYSPAPAQ